MKKAKNLSTWFRRTNSVLLTPRNRFTETHFEPHIKAIGSLLLAWNDLHEKLCPLFVMAMGIGQFTRTYAIWHETQRDYAKRRLLRVALANIPESQTGGRPKLVEEILWLLNAADKLEGLRDDSAHTPLQYSFSTNILSLTDLLSAGNFFLEDSPAVLPDITSQNPRAVRLKKSNQNPLIEYRYARERALVLRDYAMAIDFAWYDARASWPERHDLPERRSSRRSKGSAPRQKQK